MGDHFPSESNLALLDRLFEHDFIRLEKGPIFEESPITPAQPIPFERVEGMLLGLAIGDALGAPTESMLPKDRQARFGEMRDYIPNRYVDECRGFPTDDTQMAFWTLEQYLADGRLIPENLAKRFARERIFGIGRSVSQFLRNLEKGLPWYQAGAHSAGNGALMRIAPVLVPHVRNPTKELWADVALAAVVTHNDRASTACCVAFVGLLWDLLAMSSPPEPDWWLERFLERARSLEGEANLSTATRNIAYTGPLHRFVAEQIPLARTKSWTTREACDHWYSSAYLLETMPAVLYILTLHGDDPEEAIVRAVNDTKDNDTVAAIVGAAIGALHGRQALPPRWIENLSGRTNDRNDGHIFHLMASARDRWFFGH